MKKVLALVAIVLGCSATSVMAQGPGGGQQMDPAQRMAMMKERLKPVGLSDVKADSAIAVWSDRAMMQAVYGGANMRDMSPEDRQAKTKELNDARAKRLEKAGFTADEIKKTIEALSFRPGGGGGRQ